MIKNKVQIEVMFELDSTLQCTLGVEGLSGILKWITNNLDIDARLVPLQATRQWRHLNLKMRQIPSTSTSASRVGQGITDL